MKLVYTEDATAELQRLRELIAVHNSPAAPSLAASPFTGASGGFGPPRGFRSARVCHFQHLQQLVHGTHQAAGQGADAGLSFGQFKLPGFLAKLGIGHDGHEFLLFLL